MAAVDAAAGRIAAAEVAAVEAVGSHLRGFETGDVLLAKISPSFENGKVAVVSGLESDVGFGSSEFHVLRPGDSLLADYLWLVLRREVVRAQLVPTMSGRAGQQRLARAALERLAIPVPPTRAEQAAIVKEAMRADEPQHAALEQAERALAGADDVRAAILADATSSAAPWEWRRLGDLVPADRPLRYGIVQPGSEWPGGVPYVRVRDFERGTIALDRLGHTDPAIAERYQAAVLHAGDLLVSIRGTVGKVARVPPELNGAHTTQDAARISGLDDTLSDWIALVLRSPGCQQRLREHTTGRAVQGVSVAALRELQVHVPPVAEMTRRCALAAAALAEVDAATLTIGEAIAVTRRVREMTAVGLTLGAPDVGALPLLPGSAPAPAPAAEVPKVESGVPGPVPVPEEAPRIVHAIGQAGGRVDATTLLARQKHLEPDEFYAELWEAVQARWLREPPPGSSTLELDDAP